MIIVENPHLLSSLCRLAFVVKNLDIKFDPYSRQIVLMNKYNMFSISQWRHFLSLVLTMTHILQCLLAKSSTQIETVLVWLSLATLVLLQTSVVEIWKKPRELQDVINMFFQLHSIVPGKSKEGRTPFPIIVNLFVVHGMIASAILFPIGFAHILHWMNPCKPTLLGYWLIRKCYTNTDAANIAESAVDFLSQLVVTLTYHWLWAFTYHGSVFVVAIMQILVIISMRQLIER